MPFGGQVSPGSPSKITSFRYSPEFGPAAARYSDIDSEGLAIAKLRERGAKEQQQYQLGAEAGEAQKARDAEAAQRAADRDLQLKLGMEPWNFKREVFGTVSPLLTGLMGGQGAGLVGGANTPQPGVTMGPVWTPQMVDEQVNAQKAGNAAAAASQSRQAAQKTAASGFGTRSPLLAALQGGIQMGRMGADAEAERATRWGAAEGNAKQRLAAEKLASDQWNAWQDADIRRRMTNANYTTSLASTLAGMV